MKTILVVFTKAPLSVEQINRQKLKQYCFRTENNITIGDILKSEEYESNMVVTAVLDKDYMYCNVNDGKMSNCLNNTYQYSIPILVLGEKEFMTRVYTVSAIKL